MNLFAYSNKLLAVVVEMISKQLFMSYNVLLCLYITVGYENHELITILSSEKYSNTFLLSGSVKHLIS